MKMLRRALLILVMVTGGGLFVFSMYLMFKYDLPWYTKKWGYEKTGPWFLGVIGLVLFGWSFFELRISARCESKEK